MANRKVKHGQSGKNKTLTYTSWKAMHLRCNSKEPRLVKMYAGITVCERWSGENGFINFLADMGERPNKNLTLDRIISSKGYSPDNCRWATSKQQNNNKKDVIKILFNGQVKCASDWSKSLGKYKEYVSKHLRSGKTLQQIFKSDEVSFV